MPKKKVTVVENGIDKEIEVDVPDEVKGGWGDVKSFRYLGKRVPRIEGHLKVTGAAQYTYDINLPGMLFGRILRSPYPAAKVIFIDISKAKSLPGVKAVVAGEVNFVRFAGDDVAAVAAESDYIAQDALALIKVEYQQQPFVVREEKAKESNAPQVLRNDNNVQSSKPKITGDVDEAFKNADAIVEATFRTQVQTHACLETHGAVAQWRGENLKVWCSTQGISSVKSELVNAFGLKANQVRVLCDHMGGGFGSKFGAGAYTVTAAKLAKQAGAPVKLMLPREDEFLCVGNRPSSIQKIKAGATKDGKLVAFQMESYGTGGIAGGSGVPQPYIYKVPNIKINHDEVHINAGPACAMRAPGHPQAAFAMESIMDELAYKLGMDPLEFRLQNDDNETRMKEFELGAREIGWTTRRQKVPGAGNSVIKTGLGCGTSNWGGGGGGSQAIVKIYGDGTVEVGIGTQDLGTGTRTYIAGIAADELGLELSQINVHIGDTDLPPSGGSGGSTTAASVSPTVKIAVDDARQKLFEKVAPLLNASAQELAISPGKIIVKEHPERSITWKQATSRLGMDVINSVGMWAPGLSSKGVAGVQFAEVTVDTQTGQVKVNKIVAVNDFGFVLNRLTAENQIIGGVIQGLSWALYENRLLDEQTGRMVNPNFETYKIAHAMEIPEIIPIIYDQPERGVIGLGEPPAIPTAGAIANAVYNACGARVYELPITPDKVLAALKKV